MVGAVTGVARTSAPVPGSELTGITGWVSDVVAALGELGVGLPLLDRRDVDRAVDWFDRHGPSAVVLGRLVPGVRSLISLPAGATGMPLLRFCLLTAVGSVAWNAALLAAGYALGTQYRLVEQYADVLDRVLVGVLSLLLVLAVARRVRQRAR